MQKKANKILIVALCFLIIVQFACIIFLNSKVSRLEDHVNHIDFEMYDYDSRISVVESQIYDIERWLR
jgi:hypothetical protein